MKILDGHLFSITSIGSRVIIIKGIGKMFYQEGFPISLGVSRCKELGYEVSYLHIADELLKNGWKPETVLKRLGEDNQDALKGEERVPLDLIREFVFKEYEDQREMIFNYLFKDKEHALEELRSIYAR